MAMSIEQDVPSVTVPPVRALWRSLPGRAMSAVVVVNGALWLILDPDKADTAGVGDLARHAVVTLLDAGS